MFFENLTVNRVIIHEVYQRLDDRRPVDPTYGTQLLNLTADAMDFFRERIINAMGSQSQSMEMDILAPTDPACALEIASELRSADDRNFIDTSRRFADRLTAAQTSRNLPGGIVVVFDGRAGNPGRSIVGVIKAETHQGFRHTDQLQVEYLRDLFLGPQTKLYKIGIFSYSGRDPAPELPNGWQATVYDTHMTRSNRDGAAQYFYESFLGCTLPANGARLTKMFFDSTKEFINKLDVAPEQKTELLTGLYTYLKIDRSPTVELAAFSEQYLAQEFKDDYQNFMVRQDFPTNAVPKDISDIESSLRQRRLRFNRNIQLTAPPDAFQDLIVVETIEGEAGEDGVAPEWTRITIRDRVQDQS